MQQQYCECNIPVTVYRADGCPPMFFCESVTESKSVEPGTYSSLLSVEPLYQSSPDGWLTCHVRLVGSVPMKLVVGIPFGLKAIK